MGPTVLTGLRSNLIKWNVFVLKGHQPSDRNSTVRITRVYLCHLKPMRHALPLSLSPSLSDSAAIFRWWRNPKSTTKRSRFDLSSSGNISLLLSFLPYGWNPLCSLNPRVSLTLCLFLFAPFIIINKYILCNYDGSCFLTEGFGFVKVESNEFSSMLILIASVSLVLADQNLIILNLYVQFKGYRF